MFKPNEIEHFSMMFDEQMKALENQVMEDIVRRIRINGEITRSADWQINRLIQFGMSKKDIENALKTHLKISDEDIREMYENVIEEGYARDNDIYNGAGIERIPYEENDELQQLISATAQQTGGEMKNISQSLGFAVKGKNGKLEFTPLAEYYQNTLDSAISGIASGVFDYNTVLKRVVSELTNSGLRTVDYASGRSSRIEVAARRSVMTGLSQLTAKVNESNAEELGTDMFETTWHSGARPEHQVWQGRWYTKKQLVSVCGLGSVTGLCGANCYHSYFPVIPGLSEPTYTEEQLSEMNRKENTPTDYYGREYTKYGALQRQRRLETAMRAQRQKIHLLKVGEADEDDIINARCRYRGISQEYTRFSKAMNLPEQRQRVTVDGLGDIGKGKWKVGGERIEAQFPRGFKDPRSVGEKISEQALKDFADRAQKMNIRLGTGKEGSFGGFKNYRGDPQVLDDVLKHIQNNQPILTKLSGDDKIILKYGNVLDESGRVDTGAFALTKGRTVTLNKFMYDDTDYLIKEYSDMVKSGHFVKGTDYRNIVDHEIGHVSAHQRKQLVIQLRKLCYNKALAKHITYGEFVEKNISEYAGYMNELPAELNSMFNSGNRDLAFELFKEVGLI